MGERGEEGVARPGEMGKEAEGRDCRLCTLKVCTELCFSGEKQNSHWLDFDRRSQHPPGSEEHGSVKCINFLWPCEAIANIV